MRTNNKDNWNKKVLEISNLLTTTENSWLAIIFTWSSRYWTHSVSGFHKISYINFEIPNLYTFPSEGDIWKSLFMKSFIGPKNFKFGTQIKLVSLPNKQFYMCYLGQNEFIYNLELVWQIKLWVGSNNLGFQILTL